MGCVCRLVIEKHGRRPCWIQIDAREAVFSAPRAFSVPIERMTVNSCAEIAAGISRGPRLQVPSGSAAIRSSIFESLLPLFT